MMTHEQEQRLMQAVNTALKRERVQLSVTSAEKFDLEVGAVTKRLLLRPHRHRAGHRSALEPRECRRRAERHPPQAEVCLRGAALQ